MSYVPKKKFGESTIIPIVIIVGALALIVGALAYNGAFQSFFSPHHTQPTE